MDVFLPPRKDGPLLFPKVFHLYRYFRNRYETKRKSARLVASAGNGTQLAEKKGEAKGHEKEEKAEEKEKASRVRTDAQRVDALLDF